MSRWISSSGRARSTLGLRPAASAARHTAAPTCTCASWLPNGCLPSRVARTAKVDHARARAEAAAAAPMASRVAGTTRQGLAETTPKVRHATSANAAASGPTIHSRDPSARTSPSTPPRSIWSSRLARSRSTMRRRTGADLMPISPKRTRTPSGGGAAEGTAAPTPPPPLAFCPRAGGPGSFLEAPPPGPRMAKDLEFIPEAREKRILIDFAFRLTVEHGALDVKRMCATAEAFDFYEVRGVAGENVGKPRRDLCVDVLEVTSESTTVHVTPTRPMTYQEMAAEMDHMVTGIAQHYLPGGKAKGVKVQWVIPNTGIASDMRGRLAVVH